MSPPPGRPVEFEAGETLELLVHQFTDPYTFLRELVQNSLDAGSSRVDVLSEFRPASNRGGPGLAVLTVEDTGEGMNREILDTRLTRLFSSSKEGDLTRIGKFGIGFVSVFALDPSFVVVDTGRDGEAWRLVFHPDRHFERIALDNPVDGTRVQVLKPARADEFEKMRRRARETVVYWCRYCEADIFFDGERINETFGFGVPRALRHEVPGTEIVVAPSADEQPFFGFYNRGLTLLEGHQALVPGIQFKLKSRYLEHTLTRDRVLQDENYEKAMAALREAVDGPLRRALFQEAAQGGPDEVLGMLVPRLENLPRELEELPLLPTLHGPALSLAGLRATLAGSGPRELAWDEEPSRASEALAREGVPVLAWEGPGRAPGREALIQAAVGPVRLVRVRESWACPLLRPDLPEPSRELLARVEHLLRRAGSPHQRVVAASLSEPGSWAADLLYLVQEKPGTLQRHEPGPERRGWWLLGGRRSTVVLNLDHPLVAPHFELQTRHPELAAYLLAKCLALQDGLDARTESVLVEAALEEEARTWGPA